MKTTIITKMENTMENKELILECLKIGLTGTFAKGFGAYAGIRNKAARSEAREKIESIERGEEVDYKQLCIMICESFPIGNNKFTRAEYLSSKDERHPMYEYRAAVEGFVIPIDIPQPRT